MPEFAFAFRAFEVGERYEDLFFAGLAFASAEF
jgi:hypothetical protein